MLSTSWADLFIGFCFLQMLLLKRKMGPKKCKIVRKIEVSTDTPTNFKFRDTAADIQRRREERQQRDREEEGQKQ